MSFLKPYIICQKATRVSQAVAWPPPSHYTGLYFSIKTFKDLSFSSLIKYGEAEHCHSN